MVLVARGQLDSIDGVGIEGIPDFRDHQDDHTAWGDFFRLDVKGVVVVKRVHCRDHFFIGFPADELAVVDDAKNGRDRYARETGDLLVGRFRWLTAHSILRVKKNCPYAAGMCAGIMVAHLMKNVNTILKKIK